MKTPCRATYMTNLLRLYRRLYPRYRVAITFTIVLAFVMSGAIGPGQRHGTLWAQAANPCALLTIDEIKSLADKSSVADGVPRSLPDVRHVGCDYMWGTGTRRVKLAIDVTDPSLMFPGLSPDQVKQRILESVRAGTYDDVIPEVGDAAVFRPDSVVYASATAIVKGRILQLHLDGLYARGEKDHLTGLLKAAASRM